MYIGHKHATRRGARLCARVDPAMYSDTAIRTSLASLPSLLHHDAGALADQRARQSFKTTTLITQTAQLADGEASHITIKKTHRYLRCPQHDPNIPRPRGPQD
jgi:hypothetical protein